MMTDRLIALAMVAVSLAASYFLCMRATPGKGWLRVAERVCAGVILCYLCGLALSPLGIAVPQNPLSALSAGYLGLPGVALAAILAGMP